ncbi:MAG: anthranilate phosphoribosyltransferase [Pseudomonadota bacterium]
MSQNLEAIKQSTNQKLAGLHAQLKILADRKTLSSSAMKDAITRIFDGDAQPLEIAAFLMGLRARGETPDEIAAAADVMRARAIPVRVPDTIDIVDVCGTGGDGANTVNISTAAAIIAAAAGVPIAKHGNKAASSKSGSSDVLAALGVNLEATPAQVGQCIEEAGIGFMFAPRHHGATARVAPIRKALGVRTLFNILGPLANPAGAKRQLIGVFDKSFLEPIAEALIQLGSKRAWVVHGSDGLDELTVSDTTLVASLEEGEISIFEVSPESLGLKRWPLDMLKGGDAEENAQRLRAVLAGEAGAYRDVAILNAAATLLVGGVVKSLKDGAEQATAAIDNGSAQNSLAALVKVSHVPAEKTTI